MCCCFSLYHMHVDCWEQESKGITVTDDYACMHQVNQLLKVGREESNVDAIK